MGVLELIRRKLEQRTPFNRVRLAREVDQLLKEVKELETKIDSAYEKGFDDGAICASESGAMTAAMELVDDAQQKVAELIAEKNDLKNKLEKQNVKVLYLQGRLDNPQKVSDPMSSLEYFPKNLRQVLELAQDLWPSRIIILDSALKVKDDVPVDEAWAIIRSIAIDLWNLRWGPNPVKINLVAKKFQEQTGFSLSTGESDMLMNNKRAASQRTFTYKDQRIPFCSHVRGRAATKLDALRCHIYFDTEDRKIVVGYLGPHLFVPHGGAR